MCDTRTVIPLLPTEAGVLDGLAFTLWLPAAPHPPAGAGVVVLHGAGSSKESHHDYARAAVAAGLGAICFDQRGHGESTGPMRAGALDDIERMAGHLRGRLGASAARVALRGSSMGGYEAILAAERVGARAVVAICPAGADGLARGVRSGALRFDVDADAFSAFLAAHELAPAVASLPAPLLLMHAEGDEQVPIARSRELAALARAPGSRLIAVPGGHHRSIQHDPELQAVSLRFIERALGAGPSAIASGA